MECNSEENRLAALNITGTRQHVKENHHCEHVDSGNEGWVVIELLEDGFQPGRNKINLDVK